MSCTFLTRRIIKTGLHTHTKAKSLIQQVQKNNLNHFWLCALSAVTAVDTEDDEACYDIKREEGWHRSIPSSLPSSTLAPHWTCYHRPSSTPGFPASQSNYKSLVPCLCAVVTTINLIRNSFIRWFCVTLCFSVLCFPLEQQHLSSSTVL